ncbi:MAG: hypothetical protein COW24_05600 [Candidatus Kerfeldbacteria bacterium CG15_BIG_FIL_POST_REV_8_21_14_020_45_12]|uniref:Uncharacterized protein n=1 Tax=Candidatus Kerfeldbacteria bacterium CG15_BIG_FIL_POST_REV_8_21_14_020_45_12 TaxID=2014247 RepID=A0A2M7H2E5_9BACT|nr:MAG: hypothetical protein COW24_05600 [Candidatus Kerfeldbacteria bacterium CG15_BIG_FIL_POST_REV_8_21_14_020_45_12]PJA93905.1 MAG: hypothetical protein CO132_00960 [Candidatus Kerfeldbacteria bacterium CG_4_9_14_3_um_filter_45_8]
MTAFTAWFSQVGRASQRVEWNHTLLSEEPLPNRRQTHGRFHGKQQKQGKWRLGELREVGGWPSSPRPLTFSI